MREIKFRAWDKMFNQMVAQDIVDKWAIYSLNPSESVTHIIMQYIGRKDKNGKEIYEGDIYKQPRNNSLVDGEVKEYLIGRVRFDNDVYWCMEGEYIFNRIKWTGEVVGNIYENPDLLLSQ